MYAGCLQHAEAGDGFRDDAFAFLVRKRFERFVLEPRHGVPFVVIAHPALERGVAACSRIGQRGPIAVGREWSLAERERFHPPATGGMKTTVSPCCSGVCQSPNSEFSATFSCSSASWNGCRLR